MQSRVPEDCLYIKTLELVEHAQYLLPLVCGHCIYCNILFVGIETRFQAVEMYDWKEKADAYSQHSNKHFWNLPASKPRVDQTTII